MALNKIIIVTTLITLILITSNHFIVASAETVQNDYLKINVEPKRVKLDINQKGTVKITITNICNESLGIYLDWIFVECGDLTHGKFSENFFYLRPNESKEIRLDLSGSKISYPKGCEDGVIRIYWGTKLNTTSLGSLDWDTVEGEVGIGIDVVRNMTIPTIIYGVIPGIIIVFIVILILIKHKKKKAAKLTAPDR